MLKKVNEWIKFNMMNLELTSVQQWWFDQTHLQNKRDPTFYLAGYPIPITKCYTYLGIPFDKSLSLNLLLDYLTL